MAIICIKQVILELNKFYNVKQIWFLGWIPTQSNSNISKVNIGLWPSDTSCTRAWYGRILHSINYEVEIYLTSLPWP